MVILPRLYVILDFASLNAPPVEYAQNLAQAGARLMQYRNKTAAARDLLEVSSALVERLGVSGGSLIVNDRPDAAAMSGAKGVHVGQDDLDVEQARRLVGISSWVGVSTHNLEQFRRAAASSADYIAVGPVFPTSSKANPDPVVGTDFIRRVRPLTNKPIVAIGGITLERAASAIAAGADSVAVISDILAAPDPGERVRRYLDVLDRANYAAAV